MLFSLICPEQPIRNLALYTQREINKKCIITFILIEINLNRFTWHTLAEFCSRRAYESVSLYPYLYDNSRCGICLCRQSTELNTVQCRSEIYVISVLPMLYNVMRESKYL